MSRRVEWMPVTGDSMWPSLREGDVARLEAEKGTLLPGDVVVARIAGSFVIHRVLRVTQGKVELRGDNCEQMDPPVTEQQILAKVRQVRRAGKVLEREVWDVGPKRLGLARLQVKRRLFSLLRRVRWRK